MHADGTRPRLLQPAQDSCERRLACAVLTVEAGQIVALTGKNGAGKTTLARILVGLNKTRAGSIRVHGRTCSYRDLRRKVDQIQGADGQPVTPLIQTRRGVGYMLREPKAE